MVGPTLFDFEKWGVAPARPFPAHARFEFGDGRSGVARHAVDVPLGFAGGRVEFADFFLEADTPAFLREGVLEARRGQLDVARRIRAGVGAPLKVNGMGHNVLGVVGKGPNPVGFAF